ncbi:hypothetical protein FACS1894217_14330 [Clostridia bacterium]|nr:hypothetical protein FACS1894217_14330 [Clostridia bacterium]
MRAIFRREIYAYFCAPHGYVFLGAFVLVMNLFFYFANVVGRSSSIDTAFQFMLTVALLTVPVLTMRLFSEEYRRGTDKLLFTAPVPLRALAMGKFFAALTMFVIALASTLLWVEIIALFGGFNAAEYIGNLVATLIFASVYIALGLFISALCASQTVAMIVSLAVFTALLLADFAVGLMSDSAIVDFLNSFSLFRRFEGFSRGLFAPGDLVFCASVAAFFLFLTVYALHRRRNGVKGQKIRLLTAFGPALAAIIVLNLLVGSLESRFYLKYDMTTAGLFSITNQTADLLRTLEEPVTITVLASHSDMSGEVEDEDTGDVYNLTDVKSALERYVAAGDERFLKLQFLDPDLNPGWIAAHDLLETAGLYSVVVESERRDRVLYLSDIFEDGTISLERAISSAILNVTLERPPVAVLLSGHGEYELSALPKLAELSGYEVRL